MSRRVLLLGSFSAAVLGGAACSGAGAPDPAPSPAEPVFPVTVAHTYGSTVVTAEPTRIVVVGFTEQDALLALGIAPVATTLWFREEPYGVWPWAVDKLGEAKPAVLDSADGLPLPKIKALEPDLILGTNAGLTQEDYDALTAIAPTVPSSGAYGITTFEPWQTQTVLVGQAVGRDPEAQRLTEALIQRVADTAAGHPQFADVPAYFLQVPYDDGSAVVYPPGLATAFLTDLGFTIPDGLEEFVSEEDGLAYLEPADLDVLNKAKVLVFAGEEGGTQDELTSIEAIRELDAVKADRAIYADEVLTGAIYFSSILSTPYVLDRLVPELERVLPA